MHQSSMQNPLRLDHFHFLLFFFYTLSSCAVASVEDSKVSSLTSLRIFLQRTIAFSLKRSPQEQPFPSTTYHIIHSMAQTLGVYFCYENVSSQVNELRQNEK
jgi:hypothetical protein